jgi:hypothetical protein
MLSFILILGSVFSIGIILVLVAKSWPRFLNRNSEGVGIDPDQGDLSNAPLSQRITSDFPRYMDQVLNRMLERFYRRLKVIVLKADNLLADKIRQHSLDTKELKPKIDFKEIENATELKPRK